MSAGSHGPAPHEELLAVTRSLYNAALACRPIVAAELDATRRLLHEERGLDAVEALAELDGALADAGDYLGGQPS